MNRWLRGRTDVRTLEIVVLDGKHMHSVKDKICTDRNVYKSVCDYQDGLHLRPQA